MRAFDSNIESDLYFEVKKALRNYQFFATEHGTVEDIDKIESLYRQFMDLAQSMSFNNV